MRIRNNGRERRGRTTLRAPHEEEPPRAGAGAAPLDDAHDVELLARALLLGLHRVRRDWDRHGRACGERRAERAEVLDVGERRRL